jgi:hypothetical protein
MPLYFEQADAGDSSMTSFSLGLAGISHLNDFLALGVYNNFIFPQELSTTTNGSRVTTKGGDYDSIFGFSMLLGPVFTLYDNGRLRIPLAVGPHFFLLTSSTGSVAMIGFEVGFGTNISVEYYINRWFYVVGRVEGTWDFYASSRITTARQSVSDAGSLTGLGINPNIGIGFKL